MHDAVGRHVDADLAARVDDRRLVAQRILCHFEEIEQLSVGVAGAGRPLGADGADAIRRVADEVVDRPGAAATLVLPKMQLVDEALLADSDAGLSVIVWDFMATEHAALLSDPRISGVITDDVPSALAARLSAQR